MRRVPLRVVFFGIYTPLQGAPVIGEAIRLLDPDPEKVRFTMAGRGQDLAHTKELAGDSPAVEWIDWVERDELPALVFEHDICLGIFSPGAKGMRVIPNKVFQGAAAGCAIVTSDSALPAGSARATRRASSSRATPRRSPTRCAG